jgi:hypothetical protein
MGKHSLHAEEVFCHEADQFRHLEVVCQQEQLNKVEAEHWIAQRAARHVQGNVLSLHVKHQVGVQEKCETLYGPDVLGDGGRYADSPGLLHLSIPLCCFVGFIQGSLQELASLLQQPHYRNIAVLHLQEARMKKPQIAKLRQTVDKTLPKYAMYVHCQSLEESLQQQ